MDTTRTCTIMLTDGTTLEITEVPFDDVLDLGIFFWNVFGDDFNQLSMHATPEME
jgi:hypothetical protein